MSVYSTIIRKRHYRHDEYKKGEKNVPHARIGSNGRFCQVKTTLLLILNGITTEHWLGFVIHYGHAAAGMFRGCGRCCCKHIVVVRSSSRCLFWFDQRLYLQHHESRQGDEHEKKVPGRQKDATASAS
jgi:hypothetical protein